MIKRLLLVLASASVLLLNTARAENSPDTDLVLLTENFPPYNMAKDGKNFAKDENINGIAADIVREMFKRAGLTYSLTLRFPWERVYKQALENPGYGAFVMARLPDREKLFKWVGPIGPGRLDHVGQGRQQDHPRNAQRCAQVQDRCLQG
jgi:polar amino acid transport system substrate-binding protein